MVVAESVEHNDFKRVMLKPGGEMFGGGKIGVDSDMVQNVARQTAEVSRRDVKVCIVIGSGNLFRGTRLQQCSIGRARSDYMGVLGTIMNCLALQDFLEQGGVDRRVQTAISMAQVSEPYLPLRAERHLGRGHVIIFGAGMDIPYSSTDITATQRVLEIGYEVLLMAKAVDGVYSADPHEVPDAELFGDITHREVLKRDLRVADTTTFPLCADNNMLILVSSLLTDGNIAHTVAGEQVSTLVHS